MRIEEFEQTSSGLDGQVQDAVTTWGYDGRCRLTTDIGVRRMILAVL